MSSLLYNMNGDTVITVEHLIKVDAPENLINWFETYIKELPIKNIGEIEDKYYDYISFLKEYFVNSTYDEHGNIVSYKYSDGTSWIKTYDENGNELTYKDSKGVSWVKTYDENGNELTYENNKGFSCMYEYYNEGKTVKYKSNSGDSNISTYDEQGNILTYQNNKGWCYSRTHDISMVMK
jgi:YD repeat-containing protein